MKTKEELNAIKEEVESLNKKLAELAEEELAESALRWSGICNPIHKKCSQSSISNIKRIIQFTLFFAAGFHITLEWERVDNMLYSTYNALGKEQSCAK